MPEGRTGGTHSSLICTREGDIVSFCEDVSRACSVDKAGGIAFWKRSFKLLPSKKGRPSGGWWQRRAGIPIVASKAAPLSTGIALSKMVGMTLAAFVRNPNLYIFLRREDNVNNFRFKDI